MRTELRLTALSATVLLASCGGGADSAAALAGTPQESHPQTELSSADQFAADFLRQSAPTATIYAADISAATASAFLDKALAIAGDVSPASNAQTLSYNPFTRMAQATANNDAGTADWVVYAHMPNAGATSGAFVMLLNDDPQLTAQGVVRTGNPTMIVPGPSASGTRDQVLTALASVSVDTYRSDMAANLPNGWQGEITAYAVDGTVTTGDQSTLVLNAAYDPYSKLYGTGRLDATVLSTDSAGTIVHKLSGSLAKVDGNGQLSVSFPGTLYGLNSIVSTLNDYQTYPDQMVFDGFKYPTPTQLAFVTAGGAYSLTAWASLYGGLDSTAQFKLSGTAGDLTTLQATATPNVPTSVDSTRDPLASVVITGQKDGSFVVVMTTKAGVVSQFISVRAGG